MAHYAWIMATLAGLVALCGMILRPNQRRWLRQKVVCVAKILLFMSALVLMRHWIG